MCPREFEITRLTSEKGISPKVIGWIEGSDYYDVTMEKYTHSLFHEPKKSPYIPKYIG